MRQSVRSAPRQSGQVYNGRGEPARAKHPWVLDNYRRHEIEGFINYEVDRVTDMTIEQMQLRHRAQQEDRV